VGWLGYIFTFPKEKRTSGEIITYIMLEVWKQGNIGGPSQIWFFLLLDVVLPPSQNKMHIIFGQSFFKN
jgi:hypothetical protein